VIEGESCTGIKGGKNRRAAELCQLSLIELIVGLPKYFLSGRIEEVEVIV
jgi:hypothetical protein